MGSIKKMPNGLYQIVFDLPVEGKRKQKRLNGFKTKREAELAKIKYLVNFTPQEEAQPKEKQITKPHTPMGDLTVAALYEKFIKYRRACVKESSLTSMDNCFRLHVLPHIKDMSIYDITTETVAKLMERINEKDLSASYKTKVLCSIRVFIVYCIEIQELEIENPINKSMKFPKKEIPKEMQIYSLEDYKIFRAGAQTAYDRILFDMLYFTGMRKGELMGLTWQDVKSDMSVLINKTYSRKTEDGKWILTTPKSKNSIRTIYLPSFLYAALMEYKTEKRAYPTDFVMGGKTPTTESTIDRSRDRTLAKAISLAGSDCRLPRLRIHDFRHSHVSYLVSINTDIATIARRIGDTIEQVLKTYTHMMPGAQQQVANRLDEISIG